MKPLILFYLLVIYVLVQFSWWAYLLVDLNLEVYQFKMEILKMKFEGSNVYESEMYFKELEHRWFMVAGEGLVFLTLLVIGIFKTRQSFRKEFSLARQQKNFLLSITHEFKSPLAIVKLNLQTLQKRILNKEQMNTVLSNAISETDRINKLVENALMAASMESQNFNIHKTNFDYSDCVISAIRSIHISSESNLIIDDDIDDGICINGDPLAITSLVSNLLENAIKYSADNAHIKVSLKTKKNHAVLRVSDNGEGIDDIEKHNIFTKFYRIGNEDTRRTKGTGLGLYIVRQVVTLHHGKIAVLDNKPSGVIFEVTLPTVNE
jgi:two-component system, OmpR family, phosphate regulon sensor histidine kinase PhoR